MKKEEYEYLQKRMSDLLKKAISTYMSENKLEEYTKGVLAAKSILHDHFCSQKRYEDQFEIHTAAIKFMPICSKCQQIIWDKIDFKEDPDQVEGEASFKTFMTCSISPKTCPNCGRIFESIEIPKKLPFNNQKDEHWKDGNIPAEFLQKLFDT